MKKQAAQSAARLSPPSGKITPSQIRVIADDTSSSDSDDSDVETGLPGIIQLASPTKGKGGPAPDMNILTRYLVLDKARMKLLDGELFDEHKWAYCFQCSGTVCPSVLVDFRLWLCVLAFIVPFAKSLSQSAGLSSPLLDTLDTSIQSAVPDMSLISALGALLFFFVVFFNGQNFSRFFKAYEMCCACKGAILDQANCCKAILGKHHSNAGLDVIRYMNAAHVIGYIGLSEEYDAYFLDPFNHDHKLLTPEEMKVVHTLNTDDPSGHSYREVLRWALTALSTCSGPDIGAKAVDAPLAAELRGRINDLRREMGGLYNLRNQPVLFAYFQVLTRMITFYLPIFWFTVAGNYQNQWVFAAIVAFLITLGLLGLLKTASWMSDPFGAQVTDLPVYNFISSAASGSRRLMQGTFDPLSGLTEEGYTKRNRKSLNIYTGINPSVHAQSGSIGEGYSSVHAHWD